MNRFRLLRKNADAVNESFVLRMVFGFLYPLISGFSVPCFCLPLSLLQSL